MRARRADPSGLCGAGRALLFCGLSTIAACETIVPALSSLALAFGQDLIASASVNYAPRYAEHVESLLVAVAREGTGLPFEGQLAKAGYQRPDAGYERHSGRDAYYDDGPGYASEPYSDTPYDPGYDDYSDDDGYGTYPAEAYDPGYGEYPDDDYGYPDEPYSATGLALDVAVLARRAGSRELELVYDGDTLYDGSGDPARGDLLRFHVETSQPGYLYVIGIDATGYVAQIFPDPTAGLTNPVDAGVGYMLPPDPHWWGLDDQPGVEHVYFIASLEPRPDLESATRQLMDTPRHLNTANYRPVEQPAVVMTRGLVKTQAEPASLPGSGANGSYLPDRFAAGNDGTEIVVTRWFRHEAR